MILDKKRDINDVYIHDIFLAKNGHTYITGVELYSKDVYNASKNRSREQYYVGDLIIIELNNNFEFIDSRKYEKQTHTYASGFMDKSIYKAGDYIKADGHMAYEGLHEIENGFQVIYLEYKKKSLFLRNPIGINVITKLDNEYTKGYTEISKNGFETEVLQGKPGYVCLIDYNKKEKSLDLRLEKINY